jgi:hypothetical protein
MNVEQLVAATQEVLTTFPQGQAFLTGSATVNLCEAQDIDFVVRGTKDDIDRLTLCGWEISSKEYDAMVRWCLRKGDVNVILVLDDTEYQRWKTATAALFALAKVGVFPNKEQRAVLFIAIRESIE